MPSVDPTTGRIIQEETIMVDGVEVLPKFDPRQATYEPKKQNPLYRTSANVIGAKMPGVFDVPTTYRCAYASVQPRWASTVLVPRTPTVAGSRRRGSKCCSLPSTPKTRSGFLSTCLCG